MRARASSFLALAFLAASSAACPKDATKTPDAPPRWSTVLDQPALDRAVLSVWGSSASDVFVVGGPLGNAGFETLTLHFDGAAWHDLHPGGTETFWWVRGLSSTDVWMVGTNGRIERWNGTTFTHYESGVTATLWGVMPFASDDVWAVGGTPGGGAAAQNDLVLHFDGTTWTSVALPDPPLGRSLFKVWGTSGANLYVVGEEGTIWHRVGTTWTLESKAQPLATGTLFTVNGCEANDVWAVGGNDVLHSDGTTWSRADASLSSGVNGVACAHAGSVAIVGFGSLKQRLVDGAWVDDLASEPFSDLHAVWADPSGAFWAVGGDFLTDPAPKARRGVVARFGVGSVPSAIE